MADAIKDKQLEAKRKVANIYKIIDEKIESIFTKDNYPLFLKYMTKMHNFDYFNCLLLYIQPVFIANELIKSHSNYVASFKTWQCQNRSIKAKSKGLQIIVPFKNIRRDQTKRVSYFDFTTVSVFDISQTYTMSVTDIKTEKETIEPKMLFKLLVHYIQDKGYSLKLDSSLNDPILKTLKSYSINSEIIVRMNLSWEEKIQQIVYEYMHCLLHDIEDEKFRWAISISISYCFCTYYQLNTTNIYFDSIESCVQDFDKHRILNIVQMNNQSLIEGITCYDSLFKSDDGIYDELVMKCIFNFMEISLLVSIFPRLERIIYDDANKPFLDSRGQIQKRKVNRYEVSFKSRYYLLEEINELIHQSNHQLIKNYATSLYEKIKSISDEDLHRIEDAYYEGRLIATNNYVLMEDTQWN